MTENLTVEVLVREGYQRTFQLDVQEKITLKQDFWVQKPSKNHVCKGKGRICLKMDRTQLLANWWNLMHTSESLVGPIKFDLNQDSPSLCISVGLSRIMADNSPY